MGPRSDVNRGSRQLTAAVTIVAVVLMSASCGGERATFAPDGRHGYVITCAGYLNSWSSCLVKAGRACGPRGYDTIESSEDDRSLLIACK
jgi:hypothetical protein